MIDFQALPRVIGIIGSRKFTKLSWIESFVSKTKDNTVIVSGGAIGADTAAELAAKKYRRRFKLFPVENWEWEELEGLVSHKREIANIRNEILVRYVSHYNGTIVIFSENEKGKVNGGSGNAKEWCDTLHVPYVVITKDGEVTWNVTFVKK